jgi:deoxyribonuclease V
VTWQGRQRFGAVDVHYPDSGGACAGLLVTSDERYADVVEQRTAWLPVIEAYQPGRFYLRELPVITAVLAATSSLDLLVIDGYVDLDPQGSPGLGAHIHTQTGLPVIGVAKSAFHTATHAVTIHRGGGATRPLFITAAGIRVDRAAALVAAMAGPHRIPDALRQVDTLARQASGGEPSGSRPASRRRSGQP